MGKTRDEYADSAEALIVALAQTGDRDAFAELVRRRQSQIRGFMRRSCGDPHLADDLAQQVFTQVWLKLDTLRHVNAFGAWLRRIAVSVWLLQQRKRDPLRGAGAVDEVELSHRETPGLARDLDAALARLSAPERLCIVLSYEEGLSHADIAAVTGLPLGTVKSHIQRGGKRLRAALSAYRADAETENRDP